jgi:hypothetical protein
MPLILAADPIWKSRAGWLQVADSEMRQEERRKKVG